MENKEGKKKKKKFKKRQVFNIHPVKACYFISHRVWFVLLCMYDIHTQGRPVYSSQGSKKFIITLYMRILHMYEQQWNQVCFFYFNSGYHFSSNGFLPMVNTSCFFSEKV